jgi:hypothetical protein
MALFDDRPRHDASYATYSEDSFSFLNRADGVMWALIRDELDTWFADYSRAAPTERHSTSGRDSAAPIHDSTFPLGGSSALVEQHRAHGRQQRDWLRDHGPELLAFRPRD